MKDIRLIHQVDRLDEKIVGDCYLLNVPKRFGKKLGLPELGWTWIHGPDGGVWETDNKANQIDLFVKEGMQVEEA